MVKKWIKKALNGQMALEFLMTYGWALLILLVMVGALFYFGVFNPLIFVGERCYTGDVLACQEAGVSDLSYTMPTYTILAIRLKNFDNNPVVVTKMTWVIGDNVPIVCNNLNYVFASNELKKVLQCSNDLIPVSGKNRVKLFIEYHYLNGDIKHMIDGEMIVNIPSSGAWANTDSAG